MHKNLSLVCRNVTIKGQGTSMRLEQETWDALEEICEREGKSISQCCTLIEEWRDVPNRTSAVRTFIIAYFRAAATEESHKKARQGNGTKWVDRYGLL